VGMGRLRAVPARHARLPREPARNSIDAHEFIRRPVHEHDRVPIYTHGAGWDADACRRVGVEHVVQYAKEGTGAFDDLFPVGERRLAPGAPSSTRAAHCPRSRSRRTSCSRTGTS